MHIVWMLTEEGRAAHAAGRPFTLASNRYRVALPAQELAALGHRLTLAGLGDTADSLAAALDTARGADVVVFAKNHVAPGAVLRLAQALAAAGVPRIVDVCDDVFEADFEHAAHYRSLLGAASSVTVSCAQLAATVRAQSGVPVTVIEDPFEGPRGEPRWTAKSKLAALWFGGTGNLPSLMQEVDGLPHRVRGYALELTVLTGAVPGIEAAFKQYNARFRGRVALRYQAWSPAAHWAALAACDLVLIPVDRSVRYFRAKGPNRLVEALRAGRMVFAHPIPSYEPFASTAWLGESLADGIAWHWITNRPYSNASAPGRRPSPRAMRRRSWPGTGKRRCGRRPAPELTAGRPFFDNPGARVAAVRRVSPLQPGTLDDRGARLRRPLV